MYRYLHRLIVWKSVFGSIGKMATPRLRRGGGVLLLSSRAVVGGCRQMEAESRGGGARKGAKAPSSFFIPVRNAPKPRREYGVNMKNAPLSERNPCAPRLLAGSAVLRIGACEGGCWTKELDRGARQAGVEDSLMVRTVCKQTAA